MQRSSVLYHLMLADFLERVRRYSFLIALGITIFAGYFFVPPTTASYAVLNLQGYRGIYNSAWIGTMVAILTSVSLSLLGFYLVKDTIERDRQTGVGQIIATTPLSRLFYMLGKLLSNVAVLSVMAGIIAVAAGIMQVLRGEDFLVNPWSLLTPFVLLVLPTMIVVAACALLFETMPGLRGGAGNVIYFFLWITVLLVTFLSSVVKRDHQTYTLAIADPFGLTAPLASMTTAARAAFPAYNGAVAIGITAVKGHLQTFAWNGMEWTASLLLGRLLWIAIAFLICCVATLFFHRFDPARETLTRKRASTSGKQARQYRGEEAPDINRTESYPTEEHASISSATLSPIRMRWSLLSIIWRELLLMMKGSKWWWYAVSAILICIALFVPTDIARGTFLPLSWFWPLLFWSGMGTRETRYHTQQLVFSVARPLRYQLPAIWLAGVTLALLTGSGVGLRLLLAGDQAALLAWITGALFIPTLALVLGVWSSSSKLFEVLYTILWYIGPLNHSVAPLDFLGASNQALSMGIPIYYLLATALLLVLAWVGRQKQLQLF